jgi:hypothetical protein
MSAPGLSGEQTGAAFFSFLGGDAVADDTAKRMTDSLKAKCKSLMRSSNPEIQAMASILDDVNKWLDQSYVDLCNHRRWIEVLEEKAADLESRLEKLERGS